MIERFKIADVSYFYFDMSKNHETDMIVFFNREIIYKEMFVFIDRVKDYATTLIEFEVLINLSSYFREIALIWWLKKFTQHKRHLFKNDDLLILLDALEKRFKICFDKVMKKLKNVEFSINETNEILAIEFIQNVKFWKQIIDIFTTD